MRVRSWRVGEYGVVITVIASAGKRLGRGTLCLEQEATKKSNDLPDNDEV